MVFSVQRYRLLKPKAPCELGGILERVGERFLLMDAHGSVELEGSAEIFSGINTGDLVVVHILQGDEFSVQSDRVRLVHRNSATFPQRGLSRPHAIRFAAFVQRVRDFFLERGLTEVLTPTLVRCPGLEPSLEPFATEVALGRLRSTAYLPTSPEIHLKKAMARGWSDIFEIKNCFRKGESSAHHENEFLMLEWYRGFDDLTLVEQDLRELVSTLAEEGWVIGAEVGQATGSVAIGSTDFAELFRDVLQFKLTPETTIEELRGLCEWLGIHHIAGDSFNDLFHRILIDRIEPHLAQRGPTLVHRFPPSQAALARFDEDGWADRFEFYWRGLEIANAFNEVTDPDEQLLRWQKELEERRHLGTSPLPIDEELIEALRRGIPPAGGIALGVERLYMACTGVEDIQELRLFSARDLFKPS